MNLVNFRMQLFVLAIAIELMLFLGCYFFFDSIPEVFRYSARYSGRVSLLVYLLIFGYFLWYYRKFNGTRISEMKIFMETFSVMHLIHFGFLATNVHINKIDLIPYKLLGGMLGYLLIILYPFFVERIKNKKIHFVYFYYIGFVIAMTYIARINGNFEGATPSLIHFVGLGSVLAFFALSFFMIIIKPKY